MSVMKNNQQEEVMKQHDESFRLITRMNQTYPHPGKENTPEFAGIAGEVQAALVRIDAASPEYAALLSTYRRMMRLPTHQEDAQKTSSENDRDTDRIDILKVFR